jgi:Concanavalin A-like lectin/glucanases superfamily
MSAIGIRMESGIAIGPGITIGPAALLPTLVLDLDAGNPASYPGSGTTWTDPVSGLPFTLYGGVTYSSSNGGYLTFNSGLNQYAQSPSSLSLLPTWTVETWHYYTGVNAGPTPCIVTEIYTGGGINFTLGAINNDTTGLCAGWYNGGQWIYTGASYFLTPNTWYQLVGTYDGTFPKLYVNNTLVATGVTAGGSAYNSSAGIRLMRRWDDTNYWGGNLAIVKIYSGDIGAGGVAASWAANRSRFGY